MKTLAVVVGFSTGAILSGHEGIGLSLLVICGVLAAGRGYYKLTVG